MANELNEEIVAAVNEGMGHAYLTTELELQAAQIERLRSLGNRLASLRAAFRDHSDEPNANAAFRAQMIVSATKDFLEMWVLLKQNEAVGAWKKLAEAQESIRIAERIETAEETRRFLLHLLAAEKTVFPPQLYLSSAYIYDEAFCSICDERHGDCAHVAGRIYMGQICRRVIRESRMQEVSIVLDATDKRCRVDRYGEGGKVFCTLTRRQLSTTEKCEDAGMFFEGRILSLD